MVVVQPAAGPISTLAAELAELRFDRYLLDTAVVDELARDLTATLRDETGLPIPAAVIRLGLRVLAAFIYDRLRKGADRAITGSLGWVVKGVERLPGCAPICAAIKEWATAKANDAEAKEQLDAWLAGARPELSKELLDTLSVDLRLQLKQAADTQILRAELAAGFAAVLDRLSPQPQLDSRLRALTDASRLHFGARRVPFVGREAELATLRGFLAGDDDFRWWLVTGPGGSGKSRLALELCQRAGACWRTGFLPGGELERFDWARWQPELPTLLVIDYAATEPTKTGHMLEALRLRQSNDRLQMPVRVLLLERHQEERWWNKLLGTGERHSLAEHLYQTESLVLGPLEELGLWSIIRAIAPERAAALNAEAVLAWLSKIDPQARPLFAAISGEALVIGADPRQWNRTDLLNEWLRRERDEHWHPAGVDEAHANLAALATMVGGIASDVLDRPPNAIQLPPPEDVDPVAYAAITGRQPDENSDGSWSFAALEPDILGTFFVLQHLGDPLARGRGTPAAARQRAALYAAAAWHRDGANVMEFGRFLNRAKDDFLDEPVFRALLTPPTEGPLSRPAWGMTCVNLINALGAAGQLAEAISLLGELRALAEAHKGEPDLRTELAKGLVNAIYVLGPVGQLEDVTELLGQLRTLAKEHPSERKLRSEQAKGSCNAIAALGAAGRLVEAVALVGELRAIAEEHPSEPELQLWWAQGGFNALCALGAAGHVAEVVALLHELQTLAETHPDMLELRRLWSMGIVNVINSLAWAGQLTEAADFLGELRALADANPGDADLRLRQAEGSFNLITTLGTAGHLVQAEVIVDGLRSLAETHPDEPKLRIRQAQGAVELINAYGWAGQLTDAARICGELRTLAEKHQSDRELRLELARGYVNLINAVGVAGQSERPTNILGELRALARANPNELELRLQLAMAIVNVIHALGTAGQLTKAANLLGELRALAETYGDEPKPRMYYAMGQVNLILVFGMDGNWTDAAAMLSELRALAEAHPDEPELRVQQAKGSHNVISAYSAAARLAEAAVILEEVQDLAKIHQAETELTICAGRSTIMTIFDLLERDRYEDARRLARNSVDLLLSECVRQDLRESAGESAPACQATIDTLLA